MVSEKSSGELLKAFVDYIKQLRSTRGLSQESLASSADLDVRHLQKILSGENFTINTLEQIFYALDVPILEAVAYLEGIDNRIKHANRLTSQEMYNFIRNAASTKELGLDENCIVESIRYMHDIIDSLDYQLVTSGVERLGGGTVELANLSSMIGNLLGAGIAKYSLGSYIRNGPHRFPDLLSSTDSTSPGIEIKMALEANSPKGHLAKEGFYITFRYVLTFDGKYVKGSRGDMPTVWEARCGYLKEDDFNLSNTSGDSGKTAVINTSSFKNMRLIYFDSSLCPILKYAPYFN